jgi:hypothetical protein
MHRPQLHCFGIKHGASPVVRCLIALALDFTEQLQDGGGPILGSHGCTVPLRSSLATDRPRLTLGSSSPYNPRPASGDRGDFSCPTRSGMPPRDP